ncbi:MAG: GerA spore germination protein [Paenibacillus sp.]|nr:GerA spore germination protein [Paenibacillus sp.]
MSRATKRGPAKPLVVGKETNTDIVVTYLDGLADPELVKEVRQ